MRISKASKPSPRYHGLNRHPHIVQGLLLAPEATFMQRLPHNPKARLKTTSPPCQNHEARWIKSIIDGVAWLESLGLVHGDLRPEIACLICMTTSSFAISTAQWNMESGSASTVPIFYSKITGRPDTKRAVCCRTYHLHCCNETPAFPWPR